MSKVATLMSSKLKVRKEIDCYGEEKKITLNKTAPYFSFETVKETFAGLRWWSKPLTIGNILHYRRYSNISHCFVPFVILGRDPFNQNSNWSDRERRTTSKGGPVFWKLFRLDRTDPLSFGPKFPESLVEWIAPLVIFFSCRLLIHLYFRAELFKAGFR